MFHFFLFAFPFNSDEMRKEEKGGGGGQHPIKWINYTSHSSRELNQIIILSPIFYFGFLLSACCTTWYDPDSNLAALFNVGSRFPPLSLTTREQSSSPAQLFMYPACRGQRECESAVRTLAQENNPCFPITPEIKIPVWTKHHGETSRLSTCRWRIDLLKQDVKLSRSLSLSFSFARRNSRCFKHEKKLLTFSTEGNTLGGQTSKTHTQKAPIPRSVTLCHTRRPFSFPPLNRWSSFSRF